MSTMRERIARAIYALQMNNAANAEKWPFEAMPKQALCWREADAALAAMEKPDAGMVEAGMLDIAIAMAGKGCALDATMPERSMLRGAFIAAIRHARRAP